MGIPAKIDAHWYETRDTSTQSIMISELDLVTPNASGQRRAAMVLANRDDVVPRVRYSRKSAGTHHYLEIALPRMEKTSSIGLAKLGLKLRFASARKQRNTAKSASLFWS